MIKYSQKKMAYRKKRITNRTTVTATIISMST